MKPRVARTATLTVGSCAKMWCSRTTLIKCIDVTKGSTTLAPKANEEVKRRLNERNSSILQMDEMYRYYLAALKSSRACFKCPPQTLRNSSELANNLTRSGCITYATNCSPEHDNLLCRTHIKSLTTSEAANFPGRYSNPPPTGLA